MIKIPHPYFFICLCFIAAIIKKEPIEKKLSFIYTARYIPAPQLRTAENREKPPLRRLDSTIGCWMFIDASQKTNGSL
jgi:hypothetical protein